MFLWKRLLHLFKVNFHLFKNSWCTYTFWKVFMDYCYKLVFDNFHYIFIIMFFIIRLSFYNIIIILDVHITFQKYSWIIGIACVELFVLYFVADISLRPQISAWSDWAAAGAVVWVFLSIYSILFLFNKKIYAIINNIQIDINNDKKY